MPHGITGHAPSSSHYGRSRLRLVAALRSSMFGDSRDREVVLAAALLRVAGVGNCQFFATPKEPLEVAVAAAIFCDAVGDTSPLRDMQRTLAYPNARLLRAAIAGHATRDAAYAAPSLARRIRRKLGHILLR